MLPRLAVPFASLLVAGVALSQSTTIAPNDPGIVWSGVTTASIDATRASFSRSGTAAVCCAEHSPGVRASFCTDATLVEVTVDYVSITMLPDFSVEVDGGSQPKFGQSTTGQATFVVMSQPTPVSRVVSIVWPIAADVDLLSIRLSGGSPRLLPYAPPVARQRVVCFGDSIVQGAFASEPSRSLPASLAQGGWDVINAGYFGHITVGGDGAAIGAQAPTLVVLAIGTNDYGFQTPLLSFAAEYDQWIANFRASPGCADVPIVCVTPTARSDEAALPQALEDYRNHLRQVVSIRALGDPNLHLLEGWDVVPLGSLTDGVHLSDLGFRFYARSLRGLNLVRNPGFEMLRPGLFPGHLWEDLGNTSISQTKVHSGLQSLRVDVGGGRRQRIVGFGAGDCYQLTAHALVEVPGELGRITIQFLDANDLLVGSVEASVTSTAWQRVEISGVAPAGAVQARLVLDKPAGVGAMFVDQIDLPLCLPGTSAELGGCYGSNPSGSLRLLGGRASLGANMTLGLDNPLSTQSSALPFLFASLDVDMAFPCGSLSASFGLTGPGAGGELLLGSPVFGPWIGSTWTQGSASPVSLPVPADYSFVGMSIYLQGALCDSVFCGLTNAVEVVIGN